MFAPALLALASCVPAQAGAGITAADLGVLDQEQRRSILLDSLREREASLQNLTVRFTLKSPNTKYDPDLRQIGETVDTPDQIPISDVSYQYLDGNIRMLHDRSGPPEQKKWHLESAYTTADGITRGWSRQVGMEDSPFGLIDTAQENLLKRLYYAYMLAGTVYNHKQAYLSQITAYPDRVSDVQVAGDTVSFRFVARQLPSGEVTERWQVVVLPSKGFSFQRIDKFWERFVDGKRQFETWHIDVTEHREVDGRWLPAECTAVVQSDFLPSDEATVHLSTLHEASFDQNSLEDFAMEFPEDATVHDRVEASTRTDDGAVVPMEQSVPESVNTTGQLVDPASVADAGSRISLWTVVNTLALAGGVIMLIMWGMKSRPKRAGRGT